MRGRHAESKRFGGCFSILVAVAWILVGVAGWSVWIAIVVSVLAGGYWAFGRPLVAGEGIATREGRDRNRDRRRVLRDPARHQSYLAPSLLSPRGGDGSP